MKYRPLGSTGLNVSTIALGSHQFSGEWGKSYNASEVKTLLDRAGELGINFIDTAECYGDHSVEDLIGQALGSSRARWFIATKFGHCYPGPGKKEESWTAASVLRQLEASLKALRTDYIDLYQFHSGNNEAFKSEGLWTMLNEQVRAGKIRFLGLSLAANLLQAGDLTQLDCAQESGIRVVQTVYNRLHRDAESRLLPLCEANGLGVLARVPLAKGFLSGRYLPGAVFPSDDTRSAYGPEFNDRQLRLVQEIKQREVPPGENMAQWALGWCLKNSAVSSVVVGCKSVEQLELNAQAA